MSAYLRLELLRTLRDRRWLIMTVAMPVGLYLLFSGVFGNQPPTNGLTVDVGIMVSMAAFGAMGAVLAASGPRIAQERGNGWLRQLAITPIAPRSQLLAKVMAAMTLGLPALVLVGLRRQLGRRAHLPERRLRDGAAPAGDRGRGGAGLADHAAALPARPHRPVQHRLLRVRDRRGRDHGAQLRADLRAGRGAAPGP
jgi:hypothetical protein